MSHELFAMFSALDSQEQEREIIVRAPFGYPGGKSSSSEKILPHLPYRALYCEPFGGSGAVMLARNSCHLEIFNDRYSGVTCFYRCLQNPTKQHALYQRLQLCLHSREEFIYCRDTWENVEDDVERAARWYYSVLTSFGSQARNFGRCTKGKAQMGPKLKNNLQMFAGVHKRVRDWQVENLDWRQCLKDYDQADGVFYLDPPYYEYAKGMYKHEMSKADHHELLERIFHMQGFVALSGYDNEVYNKFPWDNKYTWQVKAKALALAFTESNNLLGHEDAIHRGNAQECLWIKEAR